MINALSLLCLIFSKIELKILKKYFYNIKPDLLPQQLIFA